MVDFIPEPILPGVQKSRKIESFVRIYETSKRWNFLFSDILSFFILEKK